MYDSMLRLIMEKRFVFNTGVKPENFHREPMEYETWERGTLGKEFFCEDVPDGAIFTCAADSPDLTGWGKPFRITRGGLVSKYAYFIVREEAR